MKTLKTILAIAALISTASAFADEKITFICETHDSVSGSGYVFSIDLFDGLDPQGYGSEAVVMTKAVRPYEAYNFEPMQGCKHAPYYRIDTKKNELYVECQPDGDTGAFVLDILNPKGITGTLKFFDENMGYEAGTVLPLTCERQ